MDEKKLSVLLADDDSDDCVFFKKALGELDIPTQLSIVNDGVELMDFLAKNEENLPGVLFLDINMPRKNGLECLVEMKHNKNLATIPVIMFSTSNTLTTINLLFKSGADVYIHKPSGFRQLKQVISHAIPIASESRSTNSDLKYILNA